MGSEINITYETIFELLRREKGREELQKLEESFYEDVSSYISELKNILCNETDSYAQDKLKVQLENIKYLLSELYSRREKKLVVMALHKSRSNNSHFDISNLLYNENQFFLEFSEMLIKERNRTMGYFAGNCPPKNNKDAKPDSCYVEILEKIPEFVGPDLETCGPFDSGQKAYITKNVANILVQSGRARLIEKNQ